VQRDQAITVDGNYCTCNRQFGGRHQCDLVADRPPCSGHTRQHRRLVCDGRAGQGWWARWLDHLHLHLHPLVGGRARTAPTPPESCSCEKQIGRWPCARETKTCAFGHWWWWWSLFENLLIFEWFHFTCKSASVPRWEKPKLARPDLCLALY
jgi:hypothetical protein